MNSRPESVMFGCTARWMAGVLAWAGIVVGLFGCGGAAEYGMAVRVSPERRQPAKVGPQKYPGEQGFNIHDAQRASTGDAEASSQAKPDGTAMCSVGAKAGGTAWAEFQLGECLDNRAKDKPLVRARFDVVYAYEDSSSDPAATGSASQAALKIYIKDSRERVVRKLDLIGIETEQGPAKGRKQEICEFAFEMEPDLVYHYVLAGRTEVTSAEKTQGSAKLEIKSLQLDLDTKPVPPASAPASAPAAK
jgi:hypothetical protein